MENKEESAPRKTPGGKGATSKTSKADEAFIARLQELVRHAGGQNAFAKKMRMSLGGLQRWLSGGEPTRPMLIRIIETFGIRLEWLTTGAGPKWKEWAPFAHRVRFVIENLGGVKAAVKKSELRESTIEDLVSGWFGPLDHRRDTVRQLAVAAGVNEDWLLGRDGEAPDGFLDLPPESGAADLWGSERRDRAEAGDTSNPKRSGVDVDLLHATMVALEDLLLSEGLKLPPDKKARAVALAYELFEQEGEVGRETMLRIVRLAA